MIEQVFSTHKTLGMNSRMQEIIGFNRVQESLRERKEEGERRIHLTQCVQLTPTLGKSGQENSEFKTSTEMGWQWEGESDSGMGARACLSVWLRLIPPLLVHHTLRTTSRAESSSLALDQKLK